MHSRTVRWPLGLGCRYNDLGFMNGGKTNTKHIDGLIEDGILLTSCTFIFMEKEEEGKS